MDESPRKTQITISTATVIKVILILAIAALLFYLIDIILIILTAIVIATAIEPAIKWFVRRRFPRILATFIIYTFLLAGVLTLFYFIVPSFLRDLANFMNVLPEVSTLSVRTQDVGSELFNWQSAVQGLSNSQSIGEVVRNLTAAFSTASGSILSTMTAVFGGVISSLLIVVLSFYFAVQEGSIEEFLRLITPLKHEPYVISLWKRSQYKIARWIQGQFILALIVGVLVYIGLTILGVKNAFFLAVISTIFEIIPVFGPVIGAVPGVLASVLQGGVAFGFIVALMYFIIQQIESNVIYPLVVKKVLDVPPLVVMIALVVGAKLGGFLGVLLSVPLAAALTEFMYDIGKKRSAARALINGDN